ncbi:hypothetical protein HYU06_01505 [Candidatus Woesearchaeota archaeon]|nr:hypothetical protein [Candidatus Woesearchaeota archaeon]
MAEKSYVRFNLKQSSQKGGGIGYDLEVQLVKGDTKEELLDLGKAAMETALRLSKEKLGGDSENVNLQ